MKHEWPGCARPPWHLIAPLLALVGCQSLDGAPSRPGALSERTAAITNGHTESGYLGVGALVRIKGDVLGGMYCSGAVIAPQWVLTAAHCIVNSQPDLADPTAIRFYLGPDATPNGTATPSQGAIYEVDRLVTHPRFTPGLYSADAASDIALVHLTAPLGGEVPVNPFNRADLRPMFAAGATVQGTAVGFGATQGLNGPSGQGPKRSASVALNDLGWGSLSNWRIGTVAGAGGACLGDSGSPLFVPLADGHEAIVGVAKEVFNGCAAGEDCDPCQGRTDWTRVDLYATWIDTIVSGGEANCHTLPDLCECAAMCRADGTCDPFAFSCSQPCGAALTCINACSDEACRTACVAKTRTQDRQELAALNDCAAAACGDASDAACVEEACLLERNACTGHGPASSGSKSCAETYTQAATTCLSGVDSACWNMSLEGATVAAIHEALALADCATEACGGVPVGGLSGCLERACGDELDACFGTGSWACDRLRMCGEGCDPADPTCPDQCWALGTGEARVAWATLNACVADACAGLVGAPRGACIATECAGPAQVCSPTPALQPGCALGGHECPKGTACALGMDGGTSCIATKGAALGAPCEDGQYLACGDGLMCRHASCIVACVDADYDGACAPADCDDQSAARVPGSLEICGDGIDNDCADATPDACGPATIAPRPMADAGCIGGGGDGVAGVVLALWLAVRGSVLAWHRGRVRGRHAAADAVGDTRWTTEGS